MRYACAEFRGGVSRERSSSARFCTSSGYGMTTGAGDGAADAISSCRILRRSFDRRERERRFHCCAGVVGRSASDVSCFSVSGAPSCVSSSPSVLSEVSLTTRGAPLRGRLAVSLHPVMLQDLLSSFPHFRSTRLRSRRPLRRVSAVVARLSFMVAMPPCAASRRHSLAALPALPGPSWPFFQR